MHACLSLPNSPCRGPRRDWIMPCPSFPSRWALDGQQMERLCSPAKLKAAHAMESYGGKEKDENQKGSKDIFKVSHACMPLPDSSNWLLLNGRSQPNKNSKARKNRKSMEEHGRANPRRIHMASQPTTMFDHGFMGTDQLMPQKAMKNHSVAF